MTTPRLGAPELVQGQAIPETTVNEQVRYLEQGANLFAVLNILATPPDSPADGDAYIVDAAATGAWAGKDGQIAFRMSTGWLYIAPKEGMHVDVADEDALYRYDGAAWGLFAGGGSTFDNSTNEARLDALEDNDVLISAAVTALEASHVLLADQAAYDALTPDPDTFYFVPE